MDEEGISWNVLSHEHQDHSSDWYWAFGLIAVVAIIVSIYFNNILFALILTLAIVGIIILTVRGPREHEIRLHSQGIDIDGTLYRYPAVRSFWVAIEEPRDISGEAYEARARLFLSTSGLIHPRILLPLESVDHAEAVRDYLLNYIEEEEQEPYFAEHIAEFVGL